MTQSTRKNAPHATARAVACAQKAPGRGNQAASRDREALRRIREAKANQKNLNQKAESRSYRPSAVGLRAGLGLRGSISSSISAAPLGSFDRARAEYDALWGDAAERLAAAHQVTDA